MRAQVGDLPGRKLGMTAGATAASDVGNAPVTYSSRTWQSAAWSFYDQVGELHYAGTFIGACLGRCQLRVGVLGNDDKPGPLYDEEGVLVPGVNPKLAAQATALVRTMKLAHGGQPALLDAIGQNLTVAAECYLMAMDRHTSEGTIVSRRWECLSTDELKPNPTGTGYMRFKGPGRGWEQVPPDAFVMRLWTRHPRFGQWANSAVRPLLPTLEVLNLLTAELRAHATSRLTGPGVYWVPCVASGSRISTCDRGAVPVEDVAVGDDVWAYDPDTAEMVRRPVLADLVHEAPETLRVATGNQAVTMTPHHRLMRLTRSGEGGKGSTFGWAPEWVKARDLSDGDWLVCAGAVPDTGTTQMLPASTAQHGAQLAETEVTPDIAWLLGLLVGDGHVDKAGNAVWLYAEDAAADRARQIVSDTWGLAALDVSAKGGVHVWTAWCARAFNRMLSAIGMRVNHTAIRVPEVIRLSPDKAKQAFLDGLMAADGHHDSRGHWTIGLANEALIRDVRALYIGLGAIVSNITSATSKAHSVNGHEVVASTCWSFAVYPDKELRPFAMRSKANADDSLGPAWHVRKVRSVTPAGPMTVHDLRVAGAASYLVDGVVSHNSEIDLQPDEANPDAEPLTEQMIRVMGTAIGDKASASAYVPLIMRAAGEHIKNIRHDKFDSATVDATFKREGVVGDFARGIDLPIEVVTGQGASNHWSAWMIDESTSKAHIEPPLEIICGFATEDYLHPSLAGINRADPAQADLPIPPDIERLVIWYDASDLVVHPNREKAADTGYGTARAPNFALSGSAWRRFNAVPETDKPDDEEIDARIRWAQLLNIKETVSETPADVVNEVIPPEDTGGGPGAVAPGPPGEAAAAAARHAVMRPRITAATELAVERAVDRVGARLRSLSQRDPSVNGKLKGVANADVARTLGGPTCAKISSNADLLAGEFITLERIVGRWAGVDGYPVGVAERLARDASTVALANAKRVLGGEPSQVASDVDRLWTAR